jgi:hypothetical protein
MRIQAIVGLSATLLLISPGAPANEFGNMPEVKAITNGQPKDVVALIERIAECNHWGGEEPYDKARAQEIARAAEKAGCGRVDSEAEALKKKYKANKKISDAIERAKNLVM